MPLFGKTLGDYLRFAQLVLIVTVAVGLVRLGLSLAGMNGVANWFSVTAVGLVALVYFGVRVHTAGFGGYKQLLILVLIQGVVSQLLIGLAIALTPLTGIETIYNDGSMEISRQWGHVASHVIGGPIFAAIQWIPAAIVLAVTKLVVKKPLD